MAQWVQWLTLFHVTLKRMKRSFPKNLGSGAPTTWWVSVVTSELKELLFIIYEEKGITGNPKQLSASREDKLFNTIHSIYPNWFLPSEAEKFTSTNTCSTYPDVK